MKNKFFRILIFCVSSAFFVNFCIILSIDALGISYPIEKSEVAYQEMKSGGEEIIIKEAGL